MTPRVVFMGSPECAVPFLEFCRRKTTDLIVFTRPDKVRCRGSRPSQTPVKKKALELGITVHDSSMKSEETYRTLTSFVPDLYLVVAYGQILPERVLALPRIAPLNVHFSLLPKYRGATPVQAAILNGDATTGTTIMVMDRGLDTGDIVAQAETPIAPDETAMSLFERLIARSLELLEEHWDRICSGTFERRPQTGEATYTRLTAKEDLILDWTKDARELYNLIRAYGMSPGVRARFRDKLLLIGAAQWCPEVTGKPGEIVAVGKRAFTVACGAGGLMLTMVQPECKSCMPAASFIAGYRPQAGERLC